MCFLIRSRAYAIFSETNAIEQSTTMDHYQYTVSELILLRTTFFLFAEP
jgi:hypothetical protein